MSAYVIFPRARADIEEIRDFTLARRGLAQAELYLRGLQAAIEAAAGDPALGHRCDDVRRGYFRFAVGSHVLFYRRHGAEIAIVRILHARMDFSRHL